MHKYHLILLVFPDHGIDNNKADQAAKHYGNLLLFSIPSIISMSFGGQDHRESLLSCTNGAEKPALH